jgi:hypothetical protein
LIRMSPWYGSFFRGLFILCTDFSTTELFLD